MEAISYRYRDISHQLTSGISVKEGIDKQDPLQCFQAYTEFKEIELNLPRNSLVAFTDGSTRNKLSGSGAIIFSN